MGADPVQAFDKAFELAARLAEAMRVALADRGLTTSRAEVIYMLARDGDLVQRALADALNCTPRHVTGLVDQLEGAGLVERRPHPRDRRAISVALTDDGAATARWMTESRHGAARAILGDVPRADLTAFVRVADRILATVTPAAP
ncbi:MarR family winged helix-turn-helix transcriptional regulator [Amycolatopsis nalaikhensis]|uniref:MarR family transcriptional regulator n=1 Tax=Amycolatopsis nalaikhensis TaxID=715472 RepID=A0ABY8XTZ6_9PSEU|nr:MarR family transcriptional regulator [Amycolatopsis sp. 2-2]WIV59164.1 MarR family transcriptional regulator [Amycolatopsis sp. 2-2]